MIMTKLIAVSPDSKISGRLVLAFTQNINQHDIEPVLKQYHLEPVDADAWYPQQQLLNVFRDIHEGKTNVTDNLVAIGMKGSETAAYPPEINSIATALQALPMIHELNHRNIPNVGSEYEVTILGDHHILIANHSPYPNDTLYGFIWGIIKHFKSATTNFTVKTVDLMVEDAVFDVEWQD